MDAPGRKSRLGWYVLLAWALCIVLGIANIGFGPFTRLSSEFEGAKPFDTNPVDSVEAASSVLEIYGRAGRAVYSMHLWLDFPFLMVNAMAGVLLIVVATRRLRGVMKHAVWLALLPVVAAALDATENVGIAMMLRDWPDLSQPVVEFTSQVTRIKLTLVPVVFGLCFLSLVLVVVHALAGKQNHATHRGSFDSLRNYLNLDKPLTLMPYHNGMKHQHHILCMFATLVAASAVLLSCRVASADETAENRHHGNAPHPRVEDDSRFETSREGAKLELPAEEDAFFFAVLGDRTGGPAEGVKILAEAVNDINLLEPDLVMTVGDLVQGYNEQEPWLEQMREYKGIMDDLLMPWFPVAGNHDVYWRGDNRPPNEHEDDYEMHFGPLWYAFEHKDCWFIVLYSDEGNPKTGQKSFGDPAAQTMSPAQFTWLYETLRKTHDAQHVFVFLHHPRWLRGGYGDDWDRVHDLLVEAGNVSAVFAGHIHRMRYDGPTDGIEYITLATTGGGQSEKSPDAGYLHHFHTVTVRKDQIAVAAIPVGEVMDVRAITGKVSDEVARLADLRPMLSDPVQLAESGEMNGLFTATMFNATSRPIEVTMWPDSGDSRWMFEPDHDHRVISSGESHEFSFGIKRDAGTLDNFYRPLLLQIESDYLATGARFSVPGYSLDIPLDVNLSAPPMPDYEMAVTTSDGNYLKVPSSLVTAPIGPLTLECRFNANHFHDRNGLVCKTENSDYGFFVSNGVPSFYIFLGDSYVEVRPEKSMLETHQWHHLAGVFDGQQSRLYLDGELIAYVDRQGLRRVNALPLIIGGDVDGRGNAVWPFDGQIDSVRISSVARYKEQSFVPKVRFERDDRTLLLLNMDGSTGPWVYDASGRNAHAIEVGSPMIEPAR